MKLYLNKKEVSRAYIQLQHGISVLDLNSIIKRNQDRKEFTIKGVKYQIDTPLNEKKRSYCYSNAFKITNVIYKDYVTVPGKKCEYKFDGEVLTFKELRARIGVNEKKVRDTLRQVSSCLINGHKYEFRHIEVLYDVLHHEFNDTLGLTLEEAADFIGYSEVQVRKLALTGNYTPKGYRIKKTTDL